MYLLVKYDMILGRFKSLFDMAVFLGVQVETRGDSCYFYIFGEEDTVCYNLPSWKNVINAFKDWSYTRLGYMISPYKYEIIKTQK